MHSVYWLSIINCTHYRTLWFYWLVGGLFFGFLFVFCYGFVFLCGHKVNLKKWLKKKYQYRTNKDKRKKKKKNRRSNPGDFIAETHKDSSTTLFLIRISSVVNYPGFLAGCEVLSTVVKHAEILLNFMENCMPFTSSERFLWISIGTTETAKLWDFKYTAFLIWFKLNIC